MYLTMKQVLLIMFLIMNVKSEEDWNPIGNPFITEYPCEDPDLLIWFDPGLPPREKNRYYILINKPIVAGDVLKCSFDSDVNILYVTSRDYTTFAREFLKDSEELRLSFISNNSSGFSFIIKGAIPGTSPYLTSLTINDQEFCNQPNVGLFEKYLAETYDSGPNSNCGRRKINHAELIVNGASTKPGDWPWHAAIYRIRNSFVSYICGGTLISKHFVLTVAHCGFSQGALVKPKSLKVQLGKYDLIGEDNASVEKGVHRIIIHDKFDYTQLTNDIALFELNSAVVFTEYIQPACLWHNNADPESKLQDDIIYGTVIGWGFDSNDALTHELRQAKMPMVPQDTCIKSNVLYYGNVLNNNKFCAGFHNGTSACNGDSGSGFHIFVPDKETLEPGAHQITGAWYVRGIASSAISRPDVAICDPNQYNVFTDVEKYRLWIDAYLENERD